MVYNSSIISVSNKKSIVALHRRDIVMCKIKARYNIRMQATMRT
jgi:hypothetical protein